ncbi:hypothetical protein L6R50_08125 [Myxococcota bacterium]|nr:hypothetical protein [Myxococcota bacterium]
MRLLLLVALVPPLLPLPAYACTVLFDDDLSSGTTVADRYGGSFVAGGWRPQGGSLVYDLPVPVTAGRLAFVVTGLEEHDLSQSDLAEAFTSWGGSFSDGLVDQFLQVKMAGDIYEGYAGRVKLQIGMEYGASGTGELGAWSGERDWSAGDTHEFVVVWGGGWAEMSVDGVSAVGVDYSPEAGGVIPYTSVRVPNDGSYANDPLLADVVYERVSLCAEEVPAAPVVDAFDIAPMELAQGEAFTVGWSVSGPSDSVSICGAPVSGGEAGCIALPGAAGTTDVGSETMAPGGWRAWIAASGPGGSASSPEVEVTVHEAGWVPPSDDDTPAPDDDSVPPDDDASPSDDDAAVDGGSPEGQASEEWSPACGCGGAGPAPGSLAVAGGVAAAGMGSRRRRRDANSR